uniref:Uncharacterized protein n=2 Tax=Mucochytrium quahogii TaxID=96639 RepID=A0A7S2S4C3_9STRA
MGPTEDVITKHKVESRPARKPRKISLEKGMSPKEDLRLMPIREHSELDTRKKGKWAIFLDILAGTSTNTQTRKRKHSPRYSPRICKLPNTQQQGQGRRAPSLSSAAFF